MSNNKYDNIDYCLNMLYDYVYTKSTECYELKYESKQNVDIKYLKKSADFNSSFILNSKISFVNVDNDRLIFKRSSSTGYPSMLRISLYNDVNINDLTNSELIDMKINYIFSDLAINDVYKYILLPITNFDIKFGDISNEIITKEIKKYYENIEKNSIICIQIFEHYFKLKTLNEYLIENYKKFKSNHWKVLVFQILYALYKLQKTYPAFRHNKLDLDSIYVYMVSEEASKKQIKVDEKIFTIPNFGFEIKITNFYDSYIPDYAENKNTTLKKENPYYDVYNIFNSILKFINEYKIEDYKITTFINEIIPEKFRLANNNNIGLDEEYYFQNVTTILNPLLILTKNNFFIDLIKDNKMNSPLSNNPQDLDSYKIQDSSVEYLLSSSSLTDNGYGEGPSMLARSKKNSISGQRTLAVSKSLNKRGGGSTRNKFTFNDFGELTETPFDFDNDLVGGKRKKRKSKSKSRQKRAEEKEKEEEEKEAILIEDEEDETAAVEAVEKVAEDSDEEIKEAEEEEGDEGEKEEEVEGEDDEFADVEVTETDKPPKEPGASTFFRMLNGDKKPKNKVTKRNKKSNSQNKLHESLLNKLPDDYEGRLPDWMQQLLPASAQSGQMNPMMNPMMQMAMQNQMAMPNQMTMPEQFNMAPQMTEDMNSYQTREFSNLFEPQANNVKAQVFDSFGAMRKDFSHTMNDADNTGFLPQHLLLNKNGLGPASHPAGQMPMQMPNQMPNQIQAQMQNQMQAQMQNQMPAQMQAQFPQEMLQQQQIGGKKDDFFF
jgi:hypothetical protein